MFFPVVFREILPDPGRYSGTRLKKCYEKTQPEEFAVIFLTTIEVLIFIKVTKKL